MKARGWKSNSGGSLKKPLYGGRADVRAGGLRSLARIASPRPAPNPSPRRRQSFGDGNSNPS